MQDANFIFTKLFLHELRGFKDGARFIFLGNSLVNQATNYVNLLTGGEMLAKFRINYVLKI